jgi:Iron/zinc purple acid phosphatase-like protein C
VFLNKNDDVHTFHDPTHTIWVQTGAPGDMEVMKRGDWMAQPKWSAVRMAAWENGVAYGRAGFGSLQFFNSTHLRFDYVQSNNEAVVDHFWIVRSS